MSNSTSPNGSDVFIAKNQHIEEENQRIEKENKQLAQELAAQLAKAYIERVDIRIRNDLCVWLDQTLPLTGPVKSLYHRDEILRETISILNLNGWNCFVTRIDDCGKVFVQVLLLPADVPHPRVNIGGGGGKF